MSMAFNLHNYHVEYEHYSLEHEYIQGFIVCFGIRSPASKVINGFTICKGGISFDYPDLVPRGIQRKVNRLFTKYFQRGG